MERRSLCCADGELMIGPQQGGLLVFTELGRLQLSPGEVAVVPRGMKFKVAVLEKQARGYVCENYGAPFRLPELGPIGSQGLAQTRDFMGPLAAVEETGKCQVVGEVLGGLWASGCRASQLRVVAWRGGYGAY